MWDVPRSIVEFSDHALLHAGRLVLDYSLESAHFLVLLEMLFPVESEVSSRCSEQDVGMTLRFRVRVQIPFLGEALHLSQSALDGLRVGDVHRTEDRKSVHGLLWGRHRIGKGGFRPVAQLSFDVSAFFGQQQPVENMIDSSSELRVLPLRKAIQGASCV